MKTFARTLLAVGALSFGAGVTILTPAQAQDAKEKAPDPKPQPAGRAESFDLQVVRTITVEDGPYRQRSYVVKWKGTEVVAGDRLLRVGASEEGKVRLQITKLPYPENKKPHGLMGFSAGAVSGEAQKPQPESTLTEKAVRLPPQRERVTVKQAIALEEEGFVHRGYLVDWKGQEAYVSDSLAGTNYKAGDTMPVLVMRLEHPKPDVKEGLFSMSTSDVMR